MSSTATGWDLGGAHLKVAQAQAGRIDKVAQIPCPLWQGMDRLTEALAQAQTGLSASSRHAVTMTGELADLFQSRADGVRQLVEIMREAFPNADLRFFAGRAGFVDGSAAIVQHEAVASANWLASGVFVAAQCPDALLIDVGSTTTDLVLIVGGDVCYTGYTDAERLTVEELVYTGVTRTPVVALAEAVAFAGQRQRITAELFATTADVHRLTGSLPADADQLPSADGREKTIEASARRLARMLGRDADGADASDWQRLAYALAERQLRLLQDACERALSRALLADAAPVVGAGVGRFLARDLATRLRRRYVDFADLVGGAPETKEWAARCAPAAALAVLAAEDW